MVESVVSVGVRCADSNNSVSLVILLNEDGCRVTPVLSVAEGEGEGSKVEELR